MKTFQNIDDFLQEAKPGQIIVLGGRGLMDGIETLASKHDTFKVHKRTTKDKLLITKFRGRVVYGVGAGSYDQQVALLTKQEYDNLPVLF